MNVLRMKGSRNKPKLADFLQNMHPANRKMSGITRRLLVEESFSLIRNNKSDKCYTGRRVSVTMLALASYLLIFTVVSSLSFVSSQPVTNLPARSNKLTAYNSHSSSSSNSGRADEGDGSNADVIPVPTTSTYEGKGQAFNMSLASPLPIPEMEVGDGIEKELLNQFGNPNEKEKEEGILNEPNNHNDNEDVVSSSSMTTGNTNKNGGFSLEKIKSKTGLGEEEGEEMSRDKGKVMVTDDVRGSSSGILSLNPDMSLPPSKNDNLEEKGFRYSYISRSSSSRRNSTSTTPPSGMTMMESMSSVNLKFNEEQKQGNSKVNTTTTTTTHFHVLPFKMNQSKDFLSTGQKHELTESPELLLRTHEGDGQSGNANVINNHANSSKLKGFFVHQLEKGDEATYSDDDHHHHHASPNSFNATRPRTKENDENKGNSSSPSGSSSSSGNLKSRRDVRKMNSSESSSPPLDKNKEVGKLNERKASELVQELKHDYDYYRPHSSSSSSSSPTKKVEEKPEDNTSPYKISSPLLMNKWIKTVVALSECLANCLDQSGEVQRDSNFLLMTHHSITSSSLEEADADIRETSSPHYPPHSSSTRQWKAKEEKAKMGRSSGGSSSSSTTTSTTSHPSSSASSSSSFPGTSNSPTPASTIKVTRSKSMKYYEDSPCQDMCRLRFPLHGRSNAPKIEMNPFKEDASVEEADYTVPTSQISGAILVENAWNEVDPLTREIKKGANKGNNSRGTTRIRAKAKATSNLANINNGSNNNTNPNMKNPLEEEVVGVDRKVAAVVTAADDRKSNNNQDDDVQRDRHSPVSQEEEQQHDHQHHNYLPSETVKQPLQLGSQLSLNWKERAAALEDVVVNGEMKRNKNAGKMLEGREQNWRKLLAIEDGSLHNLQIFPSEPELKVRQLFLGNKENNGNGIQSGSSTLLELSWPKPSENRGNHVSGALNVGSSNGNNNRKAEREFYSSAQTQAQVKDEKGIDDHDEKENPPKGESQRPIEKPITILYSIILEESWLGSGGYARRWKLIDQIVSRNSLTIQLTLPPKTKNVSSSSDHQNEMPPAVVKKGEDDDENQLELKLKSKSGAVFEGKIGKIMIKLDHSPLLGAEPPSKVTLRVLAVSRNGLEKVYFASLNNSYYHLSEPHEKEETLKEEEGEHGYPTEPHQSTSTSTSTSAQVDRQTPTQVGINIGDSRSTTSSTSTQKVFNEGKERTIFLKRDHRKVFLDERKKVPSKDEDKDRPEMDDGSNENSNKILTFPSSESLRRTMKGLSGERQVKKLMSRLRNKEKIDSLREHHTGSGFNGSEWNINKVEVDGIKKVGTTPGNKHPWDLHMVSMVYQKFLVVTQISWDFPGDDGDNYENEDDDNSNNNNLGKKSSSLKKFPKDDKNLEVSLSSKSKKLRRCSTSEKTSSGVDSKLNFLLSWEIFGGGLRGNLVTDTCSASISLWPDTVYIIQVGLISSTPTESNNTKAVMQELKYGDAMGIGTKSENLENSVDAAQVSAMEEDVDEVSTVWKLHNHNDDDNDVRRKLSLGHDHDHDHDNENPHPPETSADPLVLPESISFPFEGEPKVTIKSERILINTTRATGYNNNNDNGVEALLLHNHNEDKIPKGNSQSNNNLEQSGGDMRREMMIMSTFYGRRKKSESNDDGKSNSNSGIGKNFDNVSSNSSPVSSGSGGSGISDKVNVTPIQMTKNDGKDGHKNPLVFQNDEPEAAAAGRNEEEAQDEKDDASVWDDDDDEDEDEDEMTDQDESLFARSMAHHHHHQHQHHFNRQMLQAQHARENSRNGGGESDAGKGHLMTKHDSISHPQKDAGPSEEEEVKRAHNFLTVNGFYQSLYALSQNALDVSNRYPSVITINNGGLGGVGGNSGSKSSRTVGDSNAIPLILSEFSHTNTNASSKYLYGTGSNDAIEGNDDSSSFQGKLYTLFVILVISFVIFLFVVAVVGFCVLTSSIKENYKYFVPKQVRVWTTMGQLFVGQRGTGGASASTESTAINEGNTSCVGVKDSAEGSFYPQRLQEEPDYEFDDDFCHDEEDDEEVTSSPETEDDEIVELEDGECMGCCCNCSNNGLDSFPTNERRDSILSSTSDTTTLIRPGEESSVELMVAPASPQYQAVYRGESFVCESEGRNSSCKSNENCDNNNPSYHTAPGGQVKFMSMPKAISSSKPTSTVSAAISSIKKNLNIGRKRERNRNSNQHQQPNQNTHYRPHHCHHCFKNKSDVRIDMGNYSSRTRSQPAQRQEGYY